MTLIKRLIPYTLFVAVSSHAELTPLAEQQLDAITGQQFWDNPLTGMGLGIPSLTSIHGSSGSAAAAAVIAQQQRQNSAAVT